MAASQSIRVDSKGRLMIPQAFRDTMGIQPGDVMFVEQEPDTGVLRYAKAENPFEALALHAEREYRAGRTKSLNDFARENHVTLDDE